jgi:hypothetical protein
MPAASYKIWDNGGHFAGDSTRPRHVAVAGLAKSSNPTQPFRVANEWICLRLAQAAGLPVPPGVVVQRDGVQEFVSLNFDPAGFELPPADCEALARDLPGVACGIVMFDIWVVNTDRKAADLSYDEDHRRARMFDHEQALLVGVDGRTRLEGHRGSVGIGGHCLARELVRLDGCAEWRSRMLDIPEFTVRDAVNEAREYGVHSDDAAFLVHFLLERRAQLDALMRHDSARYPRLQKDLWDNVWSQEPR